MQYITVRRNMTMIKATDSKYERDDDVNRYVLATLVADTPAEVVEHGTSGRGVVGLQPNDVMTFGSTCLCVSGEFGMLNSNDEWVFNG